MSGQSRQDAISFVDDEDDELALNEEEEIDVQGHDDFEETENDAPIDDEDYIAFADYVPPAFVPTPEEFEIPSYTLTNGTVIRPGDVVELEDDSGRQSDHLLSGDFLAVRYIIEKMEDGEVKLRGHRLRRCAYMKPAFMPPKGYSTFNEIFMLLEVREDDPRPRSVQGLEDIMPENVERLRTCVFTNLDFSSIDFRNVNIHVPARLKNPVQINNWRFSNGKLICRRVWIVELHPTANPCGGEAGPLRKREVADLNGDSLPQKSYTVDSTGENSLTDAISSSDDSRVSSDQKRKAESADDQPNFLGKRLRQIPQKSRQFVLGDGFCGGGGASLGARDAGYKIAWGLEKDSLAMAAYRKNFPEAMHLEMDAHDFPSIARRCTHGCDHLHMSCPCCYWSRLHTVNGQNDDANMMTIYTVESWLKVLKPPTFSLEQVPGLLDAKHRLFFRILINGIVNNGYRVRWRIQDQAWFGIAQHRPRLIFIGAKMGTPLPPFPAPTHGPPKSGLKRFVTIADSLKTLERQAMNLRDDPYHQPHNEKRLDKPSIDPHVNLAKCVSGSGGDNWHYSGKRAYTVRELAELQGFRSQFHFTGSITQAKKQCGNAWPIASKAYFLVVAATREAFDHGYIDEEDEIHDLYDHLEAKGIQIPRLPSIDIDLLDDRPASRVGSREPQFRYLTRIEKTTQPNFPISLALWGKRKEIDPKPQRKKTKIVPRSANLMDGLLDDNEDAADSAPRRNIPGRRRRRTVVYIDDEDEPTWISESE